MSTLMNVRNLPRTVVKTYLSAARLPLNAVARANGQQDNEQWPPALAFEGFEASVETVLGSLLRDDTLLEAGRLRPAKVAQLRQGAPLLADGGGAPPQAPRELHHGRGGDAREGDHAQKGPA